MNTTRLKQARRLFNNDMAPPSTVRHNIRQWARSLRALGDKWLYANPRRLQRNAQETGAPQPQRLNLPPMTCPRSNRSDCALFGAGTNRPPRAVHATQQGEQENSNG